MGHSLHNFIDATGKDFQTEEIKSHLNLMLDILDEGKVYFPGGHLFHQIPPRELNT
jgi:hypothetical protein